MTTTKRRRYLGGVLAIALFALSPSVAMSEEESPDYNQPIISLDGKGSNSKEQVNNGKDGNKLIKGSNSGSSNVNMDIIPSSGQAFNGSRNTLSSKENETSWASRNIKSIGMKLGSRQQLMIKRKGESSFRGDQGATNTLNKMKIDFPLSWKYLGAFLIEGVSTHVWSTSIHVQDGVLIDFEGIFATCDVCDIYFYGLSKDPLPDHESNYRGGVWFSDTLILEYQSPDANLTPDIYPPIKDFVLKYRQKNPKKNSTIKKL